MTPVFLDTVGLIALWDESDQWHLAATQAYRELFAQARVVTTTTHVLCGCGNAASRRTYRADVVALREALFQERLLIDPTAEDVNAAWEASGRGKPGDAGIVDQISFSVMNRLGMAEAFTNDRHFKAAGFTTLF